MRICDDPSRAVLHSECPFSFIPTTSLHFGNKKHLCRHCSLCIGRLNYEIWFEEENYQSWENQFKIIMDGHPSAFDVERVLDEMVEHGEKITALLDKIKLIQF